VNGDFPTPTFLHKAVRWQEVKGLRPTGFIEDSQLRALAQAKAASQPRLPIDVEELLGTAKARSTGGANAAIPADADKNKGSFLGVGWKGNNGVNDVLWARLQRAEGWLVGRMDVEIAQRETTGDAVHPEKGAPLAPGNKSDLRYWLGIRETHYGQRHGDGQAFHRTGSAMDVNYHSNPWMATRTRKKLGGESETDVAIAKKNGNTGRVQELSGLAADAMDVFDRASAWIFGRRANLHAAPAHDDKMPRAEREANAVRQWARFQEVSDAVARYFAMVYSFDRGAVLEPVMKGPAMDEVAGDGRTLPFRSLAALAKHPDALERITAAIPNAPQPWSKDAAKVLRRMPDDLAAVARVLVRGTASRAPTEVRNPLLGVMDLKKELVQALVGVAGLHWGATDFGAASSGDMMHFDLGYAPKNNEEKVEEFKS